MIWAAVEKMIGPAGAGLLDYYCYPSQRDIWGGPFNGQAHRQAMFGAIMEALKPKAIVETGTYRGTTAEYMAKHKNVPVFTVEANPRSHAYSRERLRGLRNVHLSCADSRSFLSYILSAKLHRDSEAFFYLDAHWKEDLPLAEEVQLIFQTCSRAIVMIDDFQVPFDDGYGFDDYGADKALTLALLKDHVDKFALSCFYPSISADQETGAKRGAVVLASNKNVITTLSGIREMKQA